MSDRDPLQTLWKSQTHEDLKMSLADIHTHAARFQSRIQRRNLIEYIASAFVVVMFTSFAFFLPPPVAKLGCALIVLGTLYVAWKLATIASGAEKDEAASWRDFHRGELVRQRDALRHVWRWYLGPLVPGFFVFMFGVVFAADNPAPLMAKLVILGLGLGLAAAMFGAIGWLNQRAADTIELEIAALDSES